MKKFGGTFLCVLALLCMAGCGNSVGGENQKYGSLRIVQSREADNYSRALDISDITSASVIVSGSGMEDITKSNVLISDGRAYVEIEDIPVGKNRVVSVISNVSGAVIR
ncbi:MAG: hypothetical protein K6E78_07540 [Treponema sp.]|nr:hypothetical protein [Treponema sp.]